MNKVKKQSAKSNSSDSEYSDQLFWQSKIDDYHQTDLSRKAYCNANQLIYHQFQYWYRKLNRQPPSNRSAIPIQLVPSPTPAASPTAPKTIATITLGSARQLHIHDMTTLYQLIERLS